MEYQGLSMYRAAVVIFDSEKDESWEGWVSEAGGFTNGDIESKTIAYFDNKERAKHYAEKFIKLHSKVTGYQITYKIEMVFAKIDYVVEV